MSKRLWILLLVVLALALALSACQRSASKPPAATATTEGALPFPLPVTEEPMKAILTQTAQATQGAAGGQAVTTPAAPEATVAPTATPTIFVPSATPGHPSSYTLQKGEWPLCIARRYNVDAGELLALNGMTMNSKPAVGTVLKIPQTGNTWGYNGRALVSHPATYTVKSGDTIYTVACHYGDVDPNALIAANNLSSPYTLTAGQTLHIP